MSCAVPRVLIAFSYVRPAELLDAWQPTVIKGNAGEIGALAGSLEVGLSYWLSLFGIHDDNSADPVLRLSPTGG
jgi:hypothetical protein